MQTLQQLVHKIAAGLLQRDLKLATAESCTGGGLAATLTSVDGSSSWYECGLITYSNASKVELLGVAETTIAQHGAVSQPTAIAMAKGVLLRCSGAGIGIAVTGIAGPAGGTLAQPVGTVWMSIAAHDGPTIAADYLFAGDRAAIRCQAIYVALQLCYEHLLGQR